MHVTDFEALDKDPNNFDRMLEIIDQDPGFLLWTVSREKRVQRA